MFRRRSSEGRSSSSSSTIATHRRHKSTSALPRAGNKPVPTTPIVDDASSVTTSDTASKAGSVRRDDSDSVNGDESEVAADIGDISLPVRSHSRARVLSWFRGLRNDSKVPQGMKSIPVTTADIGQVTEPPSQEDDGSYQTDFGLLEQIFPNLVFNTNRETCPRCERKYVICHGSLHVRLPVGC